jgi:hypothetical protein
MRKTTVIAILLSASTGCSFIARGEDQYRDDTRAVLETRNTEIRTCYDQALAQSPSQSGKVVVNFTVEKKTGKLTNLAVDPGQSDAPQPLQDCVLGALDGLTLTPEDRRDGQATFTWVFRAPTPAEVATEEPAA